MSAESQTALTMESGVPGVDSEPISEPFSPLFGIQGDDSAGTIPPFLRPEPLQPDVMEPPVPVIEDSVVPNNPGPNGNNSPPRPIINGTSGDSEPSIQISTPVICLLVVVGILGLTAIFWVCKRWRAIRVDQDEERGGHPGKQEIALDEKFRTGWQKLKGGRNRQSTWFDVRSGEQFSPIPDRHPPDSFVNYTSSDHLFQKDTRHRSTVAPTVHTTSPNSIRLISRVDSEYSMLGPHGLPLGVGHIRQVAALNPPFTLIVSPTSIYSQSSVPQGLCTPISPLKLKPRILHDQYFAVPSSSPLNEVIDPFEAENNTAGNVSEMGCTFSTPTVANIPSDAYSPGRSSKETSRSPSPVTPVAIATTKFPSPSVTASIIRNSIYYQQTPHRTPDSRPSTTPDSVSRISSSFEYDSNSIIRQPSSDTQVNTAGSKLSKDVPALSREYNFAVPATPKIAILPRSRGNASTRRGEENLGSSTDNDSGLVVETHGSQRKMNLATQTKEKGGPSTHPIVAFIQPVWQNSPSSASVDAPYCDYPHRSPTPSSHNQRSGSGPHSSTLPYINADPYLLNWLSSSETIQPEDRRSAGIALTEAALTAFQNHAAGSVGRGTVNDRTQFQLRKEGLPYDNHMRDGLQPEVTAGSPENSKKDLHGLMKAMGLD